MTGTSGSLVQRGAADLRIGTAERERAASALAEHYAAGRLQTEEFDQRVRSAYQARTGAELAELFGDLPGEPADPAPDRGRGQPGPFNRFRGNRRVALAVLLALTVLVWVAVVRMPPFFLFPLLWLALARSRRRAYHWGPGPSRR